MNPGTASSPALYQRISAWLLLGAMTLPLATADEPAQTVQGVGQQLEQTQKRLRELEQQMKSSRELKSRLQAAVADADSRVGERSSRVSELAEDIQRYEERLSTLEAQLVQEQATAEQRKATLGDAIDRSRQISTGVGLKVLLQHDDPALADRLGVYTDYLMRAQRETIDAQLAMLSTLERARDVALKDRNWLNYIQKKALEQQREAAAVGGRKQQELASVENELVEQSRSVAQLNADSSRLQSLMEELEAAAARGSGYFVSNKGEYPLPVRGEVKAHFGDAKSVGRIQWDGLFIEATIGTAVRAIADGEVVFANWLNGFGMLVIIDHGDSYMTLYGGNRELVTDAGQYVESGATIATVGDSGGQKTSGVYFEIRHNAKPIDPEPWVSPQSGA